MTKNLPNEPLVWCGEGRLDSPFARVELHRGILDSPELDSDIVTPSDILIEMGNLSKKNYEAWRRGHVPYLKKVFEGRLSKATEFSAL